MKFLCYAAHGESYRKNVREARWHNFELLNKWRWEMKELILASIPRRVEVIRIHSSGDFFNRKYFEAWIAVARARPDISFFGYTKQWILLWELRSQFPSNLHITYSIGGRYDHLWMDSVPSCQVAMSEDSAQFPIVCRGNAADDYFEIINDRSFSILVH